MKRRTFIVFALLCLVCIPARAYDFAIGLNGGDTLFFDITDAGLHRVSVVPPQSRGINYYYGHEQPKGTVIIPQQVEYNGQTYTVTAIGERAFSGCTGIQLVVMPETLEEIGAYAFYGCTGIRSRVSIGVNVRSVGASAFYGCSNLPEVNFRATDCVLMGGSISATVFGNCSNLRRVLVDEGVKRIPDYAFCGVATIRDSVSLPQSLQYIGDYAFAYCSGLSGALVIPDGVESLGESAFHQCHSLKSITIGNGVRSIGGRAFYHCIGVKLVTVRSFEPAEITITTFSDLSKGTKLRVPCVSKILYGRHPLWKKVGTIESYGSCTFSVGGNMDNPEAGTVIGGGEYGYGDTVTLSAVCAAGYGFAGWADGVTDNPRRFATTGAVSLTAITHKSSVETLVDTIYRVDTVYAEGYKVVHDTVELAEVALPISSIKELSFSTDKKNLKWKFPRNEAVVSVSLYSQSGQCLYSGDGRKGSINMKRFPSGTYYFRIETVRRVLRCKLFMNTDSLWRNMSVQ